MDVASSRSAWAPLLPLLLAACGDDATEPDASGDGGDGGITLVTPPELPGPPLLTPCPAGFRGVEITAGVMGCDPIPEGGAPTCPRGQELFLGESGCVDVGAACPAGDYSDDLPASGVLYVNPDAAPGGNGTLAAPFRTLSEIVSLRGGTTIALSKGSHSGEITLPSEVAIVGACAGETSIASAVSIDNEGVITTRASGTAIRNLTIAESERPGIVILGDAASTIVEGVIIESPRIAAIIAIRGEAVVRDVAIHDVRLGSSFSRGIDAEMGNSLTVERVTITGETIRSAFYVTGTGTTADVSDLYVHDVARRGVSVETGATGTFERLVIERYGFAALFVGGGGGATFTASDVVIRESTGEGRGIDVEDGVVTIDRLWLSGVDEFAAAAFGDATMTLRDAVLRDARGMPDGTKGFGIGLLEGARLELERGIVEDVKMVGIAVEDLDASATLRDVTVRRVEVEEASDIYGRGINLQTGSTVGERVVVEDTVFGGLFISGDDARATMNDLSVRRIVSNPNDGNRGIGVITQLGAGFDGARILVEDTHEVGIAAVANAAVDVTDLLVRRISRPACFTEGRRCAVPIAVAIASRSSRLGVERFTLDGSEDCGLQISYDGSIDARIGVVRGNSIGACIQVDGYDLARVSDQVRYENNGTNLGATNLPVPEASDAIAAF